MNACLDFLFELVCDDDYFNDSTMISTRCNETADEDNLKSDSLKEKSLKKKIRVVGGSVGVEKFEVDEKKPYPAISDHCGVYCSIEIISEQNSDWL